MIHIIITSYKEPKATLRAVNAFLEQKIEDDFKILVVDPFPETERFLKKQIISDKVDFFLDPGEGKAFALNILLQEYASENKNDLFIFTDGDVFVSKNAVSEIAKKFKDPKIGCVTGRPISVDSRKNKYGLWAKIAFAGIDKTRRKYSKQKRFMECSGYLFAIRKGVILEFPTITSEDSIIPYLFWEKGYQIEYAPRAEVYVKNPNNWKDYLNQKMRNIKAHENLSKITPNIIRTKSLSNEITEGALFAIQRQKSLKELVWITQLYFSRLYIYLKAFQELKKKSYSDGWRETEIQSTKPLD